MREFRSIAALAGATFSFGTVGCSESTTPDVATELAALTADQCTYFATDGRVTLCHFTGRAPKAYVAITTNEQGCVNGHAAQHEKDFIAVGDPTCTGHGCLPVDAPCDALVPCCDGAECKDGVCTPTGPCLQTEDWPLTLECRYLDKATIECEAAGAEPGTTYFLNLDLTEFAYGDGQIAEGVANDGGIVIFKGDVSKWAEVLPGVDVTQYTDVTGKSGSWVFAAHEAKCVLCDEGYNLQSSYNWQCKEAPACVKPDFINGMLICKPGYFRMGECCVPFK